MKRLRSIKLVPNAERLALIVILSLFVSTTSLGQIRVIPGAPTLRNEPPALTECVWKGNSPQETNRRLEYHLKHVELCRTAGKPAAVSGILQIIGNYHSRTRNADKAIEIWQEALAISEELDDKRAIFSMLSAIGSAYQNQKRDRQRAGSFFHRMLPLSEAIGDKNLIATALTVLASFEMFGGDLAQANLFAEKALSLREELGNRNGIAQSLSLTAAISSRMGNRHTAMERYRQALTLYEEVGAKNGIASTVAALSGAYVEIGGDYLKEGKEAEAVEAFEKGLKLQESSGSKAGMVQALVRIGYMCSGESRFALSLAYRQRALDVSNASGDKPLIIQALSVLASFHRGQSNYLEALDHYQKALRIHEESGNLPGTAGMLVNIGLVYRYQGDFPKAMEYGQRGLKLQEELKSKAGIAMALQLVGEVSGLQGHSADALEYLSKSLRIFEELQTKGGVAAALNLIGSVYSDQGDQTQALDYLHKSLKIREELNLKSVIADTLNNIGLSYLRSSNTTLALEYFQKSLAMKEVEGNPRGVILALSNIGLVMRVQGQDDLAMEYYQKALTQSEIIGDKELTLAALWSIGAIYVQQGNHEKAMGFAERAEILARQIQLLSRVWQAKVLAGRAYSGLKQLDKARSAYKEAVNVAETVRKRIADEDERRKYFSRAHQPYELYIDTLLQLQKENGSLGNDALAFEVSESARSRSLLDLFNEAGTDIRRGADPELLTRERSLQQQLNARAAEQTRLLSRKHSPEQAALVKKTIDELSAEYRTNQAQIRKTSPRYAALTQPQRLTTDEIRRDLLDSDTVLLEYSLGDTRSYFWSVTRDSLKSYELPGRSKIDAAARRVYALLQNGKRWTQDDKISAEYAEAAGKLSGMVLGPVADEIKGKRLVIVADGALQYIPFSALPRPQGKQTAGQTKTVFEPMAVGNEIVSLPSASTLAVLRREAANRKRAGNGVAIVADPVFSDTDERLAIAKLTRPRGGAPAKPELSRMLLERAFSFNGEAGETFSIPRLPFTRREAESIFAAAPKTNSFKALDFEASRDAVIGRDLSQYRIVHFATHGILHSEHPELSGIVLSLVNENGEPVNGFLRLNEIYNMNLNADLVVLSACQTALGKEVRGEGLIGLTRGFMYAGSPRVVASLWKVDDVATAELMKIFYQKMLKEKMRPAAALRAAKVAMMKQKRWAAPYYWAAFELQGEWR